MSVSEKQTVESDDDGLLVTVADLISFLKDLPPTAIVVRRLFCGEVNGADPYMCLSPLMSREGLSTKLVRKRSHIWALGQRFAWFEEAREGATICVVEIS